MKKIDFQKLEIGELVMMQGNSKYKGEIAQVIGFRYTDSTQKEKRYCELEFMNGETDIYSPQSIQKFENDSTFERRPTMIDDKEVVKEEVSNVEDVDYNSYVTRVAINQPEPYKSEKAKYEELMKESLQRQYNFIEREKEKLFRERDLYESAFDAKLETLNQMITEIYNEEIFLTHKREVMNNG